MANGASSRMTVRSNARSARSDSRTRDRRPPSPRRCAGSTSETDVTELTDKCRVRGGAGRETDASPPSYQLLEGRPLPIRFLAPGLKNLDERPIRKKPFSVVEP